MMLLTMAKPGETVTIRRVTGRDSARQHLAEPGFAADRRVPAASEIGWGDANRHVCSRPPII